MTSLFPSMTGVSEEKDRTMNYPKLTAKMASLISSRLLGFSFPFLSTLPNERRYLSHRLLSTSIILQHTQPQMSRLPTFPAEPCISGPSPGAAVSPEELIYRRLFIRLGHGLPGITCPRGVSCIRVWDCTGSKASLPNR